MKTSNQIFLALVLVLAGMGKTLAQQSPRWFFSPEFSTMVHSSHLGKTMGLQLGATFFKDHLQIGFFFYGRSGPINGHTERLDLPQGTTYLGQSSLDLRADHGAFGLVVAPQFKLGQGRLTLDVPLMFGQMGAGFFLTGDNRNTPDGRRVSEWENELMGGADAGFGFVLDGGVRIRTRLSKQDRIEGGLGLHYAQAIGWEAFLVDNDYYNVPRISVFLRFGN